MTRVEKIAALNNRSLPWEAIDLGIDYARRLDELERWAKAWADNYDSRDTWAEMACFGMMLNAIHGEMEWPNKEKQDVD